jgi:predicted secreted acid phosphatase
VVKKKRRALAGAHHALRTARHSLAADRTAIAAGKAAKDPAVVLDADDTTLWTYDMEDGAMGFAFNPTLQNDWVQGKSFAATPGMPAVVKAVKAAGCTVIGLTGRTSDQEDATIANLTEQGYVDAAGKPLFTADDYYTKWVSTSTPPAYITCADRAKCTTIEYKSGTRKYLETVKGLDIVANLGDQFSDLKGGYADATYKLPNPTYYLP